MPNDNITMRDEQAGLGVGQAVGNGVGVMVGVEPAAPPAQQRHGAQARVPGDLSDLGVGRRRQSSKHQGLARRWTPRKPRQPPSRTLLALYTKLQGATVSATLAQRVTAKHYGLQTPT